MRNPLTSTSHTHTTYHASICNDEFGFFGAFDIFFNVGEVTCLLGESGCGKTTLLRLIAGFINSESTFNFTHDDVAYMTQLPNLLPWMTVFDNLCLHNKLQGAQRNEQRRTLELKAMDLLKQIGLSHLKDVYPHVLSVGMQQRICLLRTCLMEKKIVLLDEPFAALDHDTRLDLQQLLSVLLKDSAIICVTHDWLDVMRMAHAVYVMQGTAATEVSIGEASVKEASVKRSAGMFPIATARDFDFLKSSPPRTVDIESLFFKGNLDCSRQPLV